ncbi:uncharacterized protein TNCV_1782451 [Trichonephila clavipes]|nr:uncharacterized protein TNCV_1782451 [Trichonephila clavipes]
MVWGAIFYNAVSNLLRNESNINSNRYVCEVLSLYSSKSLPSFKASLELSFSRIIHAHMLQRLFETSVQPNTCNFFLTLLICRIGHHLSTCVDLVGRCLARDPRPAASKDELLLRIQAIWNCLPQADIRNLSDSHGTSLSSAYCSAW